MSGVNDSAMRVEIGLRAGMMAKAALELINMDPYIARLQLAEIAKHLRDLDAFIGKSIAERLAKR